MAVRTRRPYRKRKRAEQEEETRERITEAAVELHRTKGPANTGIADVNVASPLDTRCARYSAFI